MSGHLLSHSAVHAVSNNIMQKNKYYYEFWFLWWLFRASLIISSQFSTWKSLDAQSWNFSIENVARISGSRDFWDPGMQSLVIRVRWETERLFVVTKFYENMLQMKMQLERTYFDLAAMSESDCLIICDGGTMDIKARTYCRISWHGRQYLTSLCDVLFVYVCFFSMAPHSRSHRAPWPLYGSESNHQLAKLPTGVISPTQNFNSPTSQLADWSSSYKFWQWTVKSPRW